MQRGRTVDQLADERQQTISHGSMTCSPTQSPSAEPDVELLRAVRPALARVPGSLLAVISSPYARVGEVFRMWSERFGRNDDESVMVVQADTAIRTIAKRLNDERALAPRSQQGRPTAWAPSSVAAVLRQESYQGVVVWNASKKRDTWGHKRQQQRPAAQRVRTPVPAMRIVSEKLWEAAHARLRQDRDTYLRGTDGRLWGRPATGVESKYLLPGIARCACGGTMIVRSRKHGHRHVKVYGCSSYHQRGTAVCENGLVEAMEKVDRAVLAAFERQLLSPSMVDDIVGAALAKAKPTSTALHHDRASLAQGLRRIEAEIRNLTAAVAAGGDLASLVGALKERDADHQRLRRQLANAEHAGRKTVGTPSKLRARSWRRSWPIGVGS
jgi:hypothetical protein